MSKSKSVPNDPAKWSQAKAKAKRKFKVYPSAYKRFAKEYKRMVELGEVPITVSRERQKRKGERDG